MDCRVRVVSDARLWRARRAGLRYIWTGHCNGWTKCSYRWDHHEVPVPVCRRVDARILTYNAIHIAERWTAMCRTYRNDLNPESNETFIRIIGVSNIAVDSQLEITPLNIEVLRIWLDVNHVVRCESTRTITMRLTVRIYTDNYYMVGHLSSPRQLLCVWLFTGTVIIWCVNNDSMTINYDVTTDNPPGRLPCAVTTDISRQLSCDVSQLTVHQASYLVMSVPTHQFHQSSYFMVATY